MKKSILEEVQDYVVEQLMLDDELSGVTFLAESRKDLDYEVKSHLGRQGIVGIVMTPKVTYAGKKEDMYLAWTLEELEVDVIENVTVNRGQDNFTTGQAAVMRAIEWLCPTEGQQEGQFNPVSVEEGEESGLLVSRAVMKALVYGDPQDRKISMQFIKLLDSPLPEGATPRDGWMWPDGQGGYILWQDGEGHQIGGGGSGGGVTPQQMSAYVDSAISGKADLADLSNYLPLSGGNMNGPIQMGSGFGNRLYFENHSIVYNSPDDIGFYTDNDTRGVFLDIHRALPISSGTPDYIAYRRDINNAVSSKADVSMLSNYLPLSGNEDANVLVNQLSSNLVFVGEPQYDGIHEGVMLYDNGISLQKSKHTSTTNYFRTDIAGDGTIEQYSKSGAEDPVVYGTLKLPRNTDGFSRTLATEEWTENKLSGYVQNLGGVNGILSASLDSWPSISASADPSTLYILVEGA